MATVTQLLDHLIKAAADMGKLKDPIPSTLIKARARIEHLEAQLAATETMRDRIAMQLLPSALACHTEQGDRSDSGSIRRAYELADEVLAVRMQGSADALGETTSPVILLREYKTGDTFKLRGEKATIDEVRHNATAAREYSWTFDGGGSEGYFTASDIAAMQATYGDV